jgi:hypothetical protein
VEEDEKSLSSSVMTGNIAPCVELPASFTIKLQAEMLITININSGIVMNFFIFIYFPLKINKHFLCNII